MDIEGNLLASIRPGLALIFSDHMCCVTVMQLYRIKKGAIVLVAVSNIRRSQQCLVTLQVGELLLRNYIFIHLRHNGDKFHLLLAMVHKLYAMVMRQCSDDNPDALIHHEV